MLSDNILITGGNGFLGRFVCANLEENWAKQIQTPTSKEFDLRNMNAVRTMYEQTKPTTVIHLAATVGGIGLNAAHPARLFYDNIMMGLNTLHSAYEAGIEKFVTIGTICAYPKFTPSPFKEADLWNGYPEETNAPYGIAKKALLVQSQAYRAEYGFNAIYLLPVNLYGPHDNFDLHSSHVIPAMIRKFEEAKNRGERTVTLWGDGTPTREFLYVEDAAEAIVLATKNYDGADPVNIGTGKEISIANLAALISDVVGYQGEIEWDTSKPNGQPRRCLDIQRAIDSFGFRATTPLEAGIRKTVAWYMENRHAVEEPALSTI